MNIEQVIGQAKLYAGAFAQRDANKDSACAQSFAAIEKAEMDKLRAMVEILAASRAFIAEGAPVYWHASDGFQNRTSGVINSNQQKDAKTKKEYEIEKLLTSGNGKLAESTIKMVKEFLDSRDARKADAPPVPTVVNAWWMRT